MFCVFVGLCIVNCCICIGVGCRFFEFVGFGVVWFVFVWYYWRHSDGAADSQDGLAGSEAAVCIDVARVSPAQYPDRCDSIAGPRKDLPVPRGHSHPRCRRGCLGVGLLPESHRY